MNSTSLKVYNEEVWGKTSKARQVVYDFLCKAGEPKCNQEIAEGICWEINRVTGRVAELRKAGLVEESRKAKYPPTGRLVSYWQVKK